MRFTRVLLVAASAALAAGCGDDDGGEHQAPVVRELLATGIAQYLDVIEPDASQVRGAWTDYHFDPAKKQAICFGGAPYQVSVRRGTVNKALLYLEGGGACWNERTCYAARIAKDSANGAIAAGALDINNPASPFKDWTIVYAPYCDGSVFGGDAVVTYGSRVTYHHGLMNVSAAVSLLREAIPDPEQIVVSGSSAGGYGTFPGYGVTRVAYPQSEVLVLNDSGPGLQNPGDAAAVAERLASWGFDRLLPASCDNCQPQITYMTEWALERDPRLRVAYFNYQEDGVLQFFLTLNGPSFRSLYFQVTDDIRTRQADRFRRFLPSGSAHTILLSSEFYTRRVGGIVMRDWTADFLTNGAHWQDVAE